MRSLLLGLTLLSITLPHAEGSMVADVKCAVPCASDLQCSLNGVCQKSGVCACDQGWTGDCCERLDFLPVPLASSYRSPNVSTWGGNIVTVDQGTTFHMWIAEMAPDPENGGSCGLTTWSDNSQISHVSASSPLGPYRREEVAVKVWSHNPIVRVDPRNGTLVMWHIGSGDGVAPPKGYCAHNGTSPCGEQSFDKCDVPSPLCARAGTLPGWTCYPSVCNSDGAEVGGAVDCGQDLAEPSLACNPVSVADCVAAAAAACAQTHNCQSFAMSDQWLGLNKTKLFKTGTAGLAPNSDWSVWVKNTNATTDTATAPSSSSSSSAEYLDMYGRARAHGTHPAPLRPDADGGCFLHMHTANSTEGPWVPYRSAYISPCGGNNPAPFFHPNGTLFITFTDQNMGMWRADSWEGPYTLVTQNACGGGEDPSLYFDSQGRFHCLYHRSPFGNPDLAIGHSYSLDGYTWYSALEPAASSTIEYETLGNVVHGKRERPHLNFDAHGQVTHLVTGVCLTPACSPFRDAEGEDTHASNPSDNKPIDGGVDCSAKTQYYQCDANSPGPGWFDRTYTLVQAVRGA